ncbi:flagellar export protein FliJ [Sodalis sp. RH21]|uniref:flagellar export protein FliJ n=1 Tax=unclassified Sodalis (in: enterobacteria) TaxID=2636512 RepID=UPI0039B6B1C5
MKSETPLDILRGRAKEDMEQAAIGLGQIRQSHQLARRQLDQLLDYETEYRQKLQQSMTDGMPSASWYNYQQFIITLETAIEQHRALLAQWTQRLQQAMQAWQLKQQRLNSFVALQSRGDRALQLKANRLDQKNMDEFAQRAALRKH